MSLYVPLILNEKNNGQPLTFLLQINPILMDVPFFVIDTAQVLDDIDLPGFYLHPLKGNRSGIWSISVSGNWRVTFEFRDGNAYILNYEDYH